MRVMRDVLRSNRSTMSACFDAGTARNIRSPMTIDERGSLRSCPKTAMNRS
jgi:hypothetical protein